MKKTINMGWVKLPYEERRRKAIIEVEITAKQEGLALSICGEIKRYSYGQCREDMKKYIVAPRHNFDEIMEVWEKYHLNDMHAGTPTQEKLLHSANIIDYDEAIEYLKKNNLYIDNGHKYGSGWRLEKIPSSVLDKVFAW